MLMLPRLSLRRPWLAGFLLLAGALGAYLVLTAPGPLDAARAKYGRIEAGMTRDEVRAVLDGWSFQFSVGRPHNARSVWYDPVSGARVTTHFQCDLMTSDLKVTDKKFEEGEQSFAARAGRLKGRLVGGLHKSP